MEQNEIIQIIVAAGTIGSVIVAMIAIYRTNKNSKKQIKVTKYEEIYNILQQISMFLGTLNDLYHNLESFKQGNHDKIKTLGAYVLFRDDNITDNSKEKLINLLIRLELLSKCYSKGKLNSHLLKFEYMMYSYTKYTLNGGCIQKEIDFQKGFPKLQNQEYEIELLKGKLSKEIQKLS